MMILTILAREQIFGGLAMENWFVLYFESKRKYSSFTERNTFQRGKIRIVTNDVCSLTLTIDTISLAIFC